MSKVSRLEKIGSWNRALNAARRTVGKKTISKEPSDTWKAQMLLAEHSPIRLVEYDWTWEEMKQWVTVHLVRHHIGCDKFVSTQRADRNTLILDRDALPQGTENSMDFTANAQAIINISRKRLCSKASAETRLAWKQFMNELRKADPILAEKSVPECLYRGFCPERNSCGYVDSPNFERELKKYRNTNYI